ncbi:MAG: PKD domain-containing protein [Bacteroidetes bacterium]|nr:PKD domain-containing protein [Bacteroidota bacterium]
MGKLYISGSFQYVDGVGANRAAVWDGISWAPLGTGFDLAPIDISKTSDRIYFSGSFNNFDTLTAYKLAWIDTQGNYGGLSILAAAHFNYINSINVRNDTLYLSTDQNLYWWNGTQFFNLIVNPRRVERSFYFNDTTYIIYSDYQNYKTYVSKLHTGNVLPPTLTSNLEDPTQNYLLRYYSASVSDTGFFIGGNFSSVNGKPSASLLFYGNQQINHFGKCALPVYASQDQYAMANTLFADTGTGLIYIGGNFLFSDHLFTSNISAWNGNNWLKLGEGLSGLVNSITQYNGEIYAGGKFLSSGSTTLNNLAKWDGTNWLPIGNGTNGEIKKLLVHNNELYIGGDFTLIDTFPISFCAKFNGTQFVSVGDSAPLLHPVYDMEFYKGVLYASLKEYSWSRLKGTKWISPGITAPTIMGLEKHNDTLFVGSSGVVFYLADSVTGSIYPANNTPNKLSPLIINNRLFGTCDYYLLCRNGYSFDHYVNQFAAKTSIDISPTQSIVGGYFPYTINAFGKKYLNSIGILEFIPPAATIRASDDTICEYKHITFYPETEDLFLRYNWSFPGGSPVAATNEICYIQYLFQGKYPVTLTLTNEVGTLVIQLSDSIVVNNCVTEIPTIEVKESTLVFPNPFTDILQIKSRLRGECLYCIRDICGRLVYMKRK